MKHNTTTKFWKLYYNLSEAVQELADKNFSLLKADPLHPSLHFKEISGKDNLWAARVGDHFRALAIREDNELYWFWIGSHAEYDRIISQ